MATNGEPVSSKPTASALTGNEITYVIQGSQSKKTLLSSIAAYVKSWLFSDSSFKNTLGINLLEPIAASTYVLQSSDVSRYCNNVIQLSNVGFTTFTVPTPASLSVAPNHGVMVRISGNFSSQHFVAGSGATLQGNLYFDDNYQTKMLVAKNDTTWLIFG